MSPSSISTSTKASAKPRRVGKMKMRRCVRVTVALSIFGRNSQVKKRVLSAVSTVLRNRYRLDQLARQNIAILLLVFADRLQAVADHAGQNCLHVFRDDRVALVEQCPGACGGEQRKSGARAEAVRVARRFARMAQNGLKVVEQRGGDEYLPDALLQLQQFRAFHLRLESGDDLAPIHAGQQAALRLRIGG